MTDLLGELNVAFADRYAIDHEIGSGGMAAVYLAEDLKHHRKVAIKVLRSVLSATLFAERFLREIEITANLSHPHILPLLDSGEADGLLYYVMPLVNGESLRDIMEREKQLPVEEATRITCEVARALTFAHSVGLVHRDVKPGNVLLHHGEAVLTDFGVAQAVANAGGPRLTSPGTVMGTPSYMSPEQCEGAEVDGRSDTYSLACVLFEALVGRPPFDGPDTQAVIALHTSERVPNLRAVRPDVPSQLNEVVRKALAKKPQDRFRTATQFAEALVAAQARGVVQRKGFVRWLGWSR